MLVRMVAADALVSNHQTISIYDTDLIPIAAELLLLNKHALSITGPLRGNTPVTSGFSSQRTSNGELW